MRRREVILFGAGGGVAAFVAMNWLFAGSFSIGANVVAAPKSTLVSIDAVENLRRGTGPVDAPRLVPFQASLTDTAGRPVEGSYDLTFKIYDRASEGAPLWTETRPSVVINKGVVNVVLGGVTPFGLLSFDAELYVGVTVDANPEMVPRQQLISAIFAADADRAELAELAAEATHAIDADQAVSSSHAADLVKPGTTDIVVNVTAGGNVGVGVPSPTRKLEVGGDVHANGAFSGLGIVPIGSIVAWHKHYTRYTDNPSDPPGPELAPLPPAGWVECIGGTVSDPESPLFGQVIPTLNNDSRFLRGSMVSGSKQADELRSHNHPVNTGTHYINYIPGGGDLGWPPNTGTSSFPANPFTGPFGGAETRPVNMSVVWIMRVK